MLLYLKYTYFFFIYERKKQYNFYLFSQASFKMYIEILQPFLIFTCLFLFAIFLPYLLVVGQVVVGVVVVVGG